jgi:predicted alpha/beta hydrolase
MRQIGTLGTIEVLTITPGANQGGSSQTYTDLANIIILSCIDLNGGNYSTLRKGVATSGYQVTTGKTLKVRTVEINMQSAAPSNYINFGYGDTDVGFNVAGAPTSPIYYIGGGAGGTIISGSSVSGTLVKAILLDVPATKYPFIRNSSGTACQGTMYGYEV